MNAIPAGIDLPLFFALATASPSAPSAAGAATGASAGAASFLISCALAAHGKPLLVTCSAIGPDLDQTADVLRNLAAEITLDTVVVLDESRDRVDLVLSNVVGLLHRVDVHRRKHVIGALRPNTVDIAEREANVLLARNIHTHQSRHSFVYLFLSPGAACGAGLCRSRAPHPCGGRCGSSRKCDERNYVLSCLFTLLSGRMRGYYSKFCG